MDLTLTSEHTMIRDAARDFAQKEIVPIAAEFDESGEFPHKTIQKMGQLGFMGIEVPEKYGGAEMDALAYALVMEEIAKADAAHSTIVSVNNTLFNYPLMRFGTEEQKQTYVKAVASGEKVGAYALTEPMSGSDASNMQTKAVRDGDVYIINGRKSWITSAPAAKYIILFAKTDPSKGAKGISAFLIDTAEPGFKLGNPENKLGIRASATSEIFFEDYRCPAENLLSQEGEGFKIAMTTLDAGRIGIAAQALGIAVASYEASLNYAREREAFGGPIGRFQGIQWKIADMKCKIEASRLLIYQTCLAKDAALKGGGRYTTEASVAKLFASETAMFCAHQAVQIHGGMGYSKEMPIERYFRDAKITEIYEGTSEIQRMVIARNELGLR